MQYKSWLIGMMFCCLYAACREEGEKRVYIGKEAEVDWLEWVDSAMITPLEWKEGYTIGVIDKIGMTDSLYYLLDARKVNALFAFDRTGKAIAHFGTTGRGPEEYLSIYDYAIDREQGKLLVLCYPAKVMVTDMHFHLKQVVPLSIAASRIACQGEDVYLYVHGEEKCLLALDLANGKMDTILTEHNVPNNYGTSPQPVFHSIGEELYYCSWGSDTIYQIAKQEAIALFALDYEGKARKLAQFASEAPLSFRDALLCSPPSLALLFQLEGNFAMIYTYSALMRLGILDTAGKTLRQNGVLINAFGNNKNHYKHTLTGWAYLPDRKIPIDSNRIKISLKSPLPDDLEANPVLITYYLKRDKTVK